MSKTEREREKDIEYIYTRLVVESGDRISCCYRGIQNSSTRRWKEERCILVALLHDISIDIAETAISRNAYSVGQNDAGTTALNVNSFHKQTVNY